MDESSLPILHSTQSVLIAPLEESDSGVRGDQRVRMKRHVACYLVPVSILLCVDVEHAYLDLHNPASGPCAAQASDVGHHTERAVKDVVDLDRFRSLTTGEEATAAFLLIGGP